MNVVDLLTDYMIGSEDFDVENMRSPQDGASIHTSHAT